MAARLKCLLSLLLVVDMLTLLAASASAEDVNVTFVVDQRLDFTRVLLISGKSSSLTPSRTMTPTPGDIWVLTVKLPRGVAYQYYLRTLPQGYFYECICSFVKDTVLTVPEDYVPSFYMELVTGYDCNRAACPFYIEGKSRDDIRQVV